MLSELPAAAHQLAHSHVFDLLDALFRQGHDAPDFHEIMRSAIGHVERARLVYAETASTLDSFGLSSMLDQIKAIATARAERARARQVGALSARARENW